jgi:hypothetical protein
MPLFVTKADGGCNKEAFGVVFSTRRVEETETALKIVPLPGHQTFQASIYVIPF